MRDEPRRRFRHEAESRDTAAAEVDEELAFHLDLCVRELVAEGWPEADARAEAERRFGDLATTREICAREHARARAEERRGRVVEELLQDIRFALRTARRAPTYAAVVVATLAVGIALNTLVFGFMSPYLVRALPYPDADRLVAVGGIDRLEGWDMGRFSAPQAADLREGSRAFDALAYYDYGSTNLTGDEGAERASMARMSGGLFDLLGMPPALGRTLGPEDQRPGAAPAVVLSHGLWTRRFGGDADVVGSTVRLDGRAHTVVGVMPPSFNFPYNAIEMWLPHPGDEAADDRGRQNSLVVGRLAADWTPDGAREELSGIQAELARRWPDTDARYDGVSVKPLREALNFAWDILHPAFLVLLGAVGLVLVVACVNVASLTLARAAAREREVAVRAAIGAGRGRIARQLLVESLVLAALGGLVGVALATFGLRVVGGLLPGDLYRVGDVSLDGQVLLFSLAVTLATPLVFGLAPALAASRSGLATVLRRGSGAVGAGRRHSRIRSGLVVVQVTLAVVLVATTGLMVRSLGNALGTDLGFDGPRLLVATLTPSSEAYGDPDALDGYYRDVEARLAAVPGVSGVGSASHLPLNHETIPVRFTTPAGEDVAVDQRPSAYTSRAGDGYFAAMGIEVLEGRDFGPGDAVAGGVAVSRGMAERLWPEGGAVGRTVVYGSGEDPLRGTVTAVVEDVRWDELGGTPRPHLYRALEGTATRRRFVVVRADEGVDPLGLAPSVRQILRDVDPDVPPSLQAMDEIVRQSTGVWAIGSGFLGAFGLVALGLAALGIYGLVTFSVQQRLREMGLRLALGADASRLQSGIVLGGLRLTAWGLGLGLVLSVAAGSALAGVLLGVGPADPVSLASASAVFLTAAVAASWLPARRAARVDPVRALRSE